VLKSPIALTYKESTSITRLFGNPVISLQVIKKGGENLLSATAQIEVILADAREENLIPEDLKIKVTSDQSETVKMQLSSLENGMIMSMIFVIGILFFFLGTRNALIVGIAIPMSVFLSFIVFNMIGYRINMIVLFSLILSLGMLVDNAIVVVENIYRFIDLGYSKTEAAKLATGEIAIPIISSTATTLAAFVPFLFWDSMMGEFMKFLPITLIVVLTASLFVALVIVPVFSASFIEKERKKQKISRGLIISTVFGILTMILLQNFIAGLNIFIFSVIMTFLNVYFLNKVSNWFQDVFLVKLENAYDRLIRFSIRKRNPYYLTGGILITLIFTLSFYFMSKPKVEFFPDNDPSYVNIEVELPIGTDILVTDAFMKKMEADVTTLLGNDTVIVRSILTNVGAGAVSGNAMSSSGGQQPNKGMITINFIHSEDRMGISTKKLMAFLQSSLTNKYPGVIITIAKNSMGPPTGKPINIEISGKDYPTMIEYTDSLTALINGSGIEGIEGLKMDLQTGKQQMIVEVNRDNARQLGISSMQIFGTIRTSLFGSEVTDFKEGEDEYPIMVRMDEKNRNTLESLMNQKVTFRNTRGKIIQVPVSAVAKVTYSTTYGAVKRKGLKRTITLYSNIKEGYNANDINKEIKDLIATTDMPEKFNSCKVNFTGQQQDQKESMDFMMLAMVVALALIMLILVAQFNSIVKPLIIMVTVLFSTIGVFGGLGIFQMNFIVVMTGIGIVSLAGVVVNNAIVLIDYIDYLKKQKKEILGIPEEESIPTEIAAECIVKAGKTRLRPVLLTAITTILGLVPMALGMNIDFIGLITRYEPDFYFGGDMVNMWGPLSWTVIFGLTFATFLTLIMVPVLYQVAARAKQWGRKKWTKSKVKISA
jgi:multidrug efflux pump subunit AcrB